MKKHFKIPKLMNIKRSATVEQFWLALVATTVSIILTFGTNAIIEHRQKEKAKREMVLMIMYDFDKTIERVQHADTLLQQASQAQKEVALHPECYNSYQPCFLSSIAIVNDCRFAETTEKIFSSNIETFNTLGNVNFVHAVSAFYNARHYYQESVIDALEADVAGSGVFGSIGGLFSVDFPTHYVTNKQSLVQLKSIRNRCMKMMKVSEEELKEFGQQRVVEDEVSEEDERIHEQAIQEYLETEKVIREAKEKFLEEEQ